MRKELSISFRNSTSDSGTDGILILDNSSINECIFSLLHIQVYKNVSH